MDIFTIGKARSSAQKEFQAELERFPDDPVANCHLGEILLNKNQASTAVTYFHASLKTNPRYSEALLGLGRTELAMNDPKDALPPLRKAVEIDPENFQAHYILGNALRATGTGPRSGVRPRDGIGESQLEARGNHRRS